MSEEEAPPSSSSTSTSGGLSAVVLGSTGAIGEYLIKHLIQSPNITSITAITRRDVQFGEDPNKKVNLLIVPNLDNLQEAAFPKNADISFCCIGTTRAEVKSDEQFRKVDYGYVETFAKLSKENGVKQFHAVSSAGGSKSSWFLYLRTKGEMEEMVKSFRFPVTIIYRPGLLDRGNKARSKEKLASWFMSSIRVSQVAEAMLSCALDNHKRLSSDESKEPFPPQTLENQQMIALVEKISGCCGKDEKH